MPFPRILLAAEADILAVRATTLSDYGPAKLAEYDELLEEALEALTENPRAGRPRPEIAPSAWIFRIDLKKRGIPHVFLYRILDDDRVEVRGLLHGAMHLRRQWRQRDPR
jgi:plasmid stabilization system protein ParE